MRLPRHEGQKPRPLQLKCDKPTLAACLAFQPCEAPAQQAAGEVAVELLAHERRQRDGQGPLVDRGVQRGQVVAQNLRGPDGLLGYSVAVDREVTRNEIVPPGWILPVS